MSKFKKSALEVQGITVALLSTKDSNYISLTDIARYRELASPDDSIRNWLRNRNTVEFLDLWEQLHNPSFNPVESDGIKMQVGLNSFSLSVKQWIEKTGAIGISSKAGRYGGTYAHADIAFEFASWLSVEFRLYLAKEFQRLKTEESARLNEGREWDLNRTLFKINYRIHTDAIKAHIIPATITGAQANKTYADEADVLNVALFGQTAAQWKNANPELAGNQRDNATIHQLLVLANLESLNAELIRMEIEQSARIGQLNRSAIAQLQSLAARNLQLPL